ncbi:hypothetical protein [Pseudoalteromonas agarivorans]|uniref:Uncharacterized protein n=1 Tax=Pseudoalteromonas agarivorans DSM 14585 TaxID=1312369 RepID=A0ACA8DSK3_9GAMM|nr:hypothetical protein [Pseudoalteromonas agarivorans]ATC81061.1 hypothetical protein PAGA_a0507 [Pseudoalteromonas agarivorans DSM 14585]
MKNLKVNILVDYREQFYSSVRSSTIGFDLDKVKSNFEDNGCYVDFLNFTQVDFNADYNGVIFLYQSSEDRDLYYKSYIQDVIYFLELNGAILIPSFKYFMCHHNKVMQELLIKKQRFECLKVLNSFTFGTYEELKKYGYSGTYPVVLKSASGCTSKGVSLIRNKEELIRNVKKITASFNLHDYLRFKYKEHFKKNYISESTNRQKFILQEFVPGLSGDYKVLVYSGKYYVLNRKNRKNDFRASGSGMFEFLSEPPVMILEAAKEIFNKLSIPYISIDLALNNDEVYLIEYQMLMFGTLTLEKSEQYFEKNNGVWRSVAETPDLEKEFVNSVLFYIKNNNLNA